MKRKVTPTRIAATAIVALGVLGLNLHSSQADGTTSVPGLAILNISDGTAPFDATAGLGSDTDAHNGVVRAGDISVVRFDSSLNDASTSTPTTYQHATITTTALPLGFRYASLPIECLAPASSISGDGVTTPSAMTCDMGPKSTGSAWSVATNVATLAAVVEGTLATVSATLTVQGVTAIAPASAAAIAATGAPKIDVQLGAPWPAGSKLVNGEAGYVYIYSLGVKLKPGSQSPKLPLTLTNDLTAISPNARLLACGVNGERVLDLDWAYGFGMPEGKPGGLYGTYKGTTINSVEDSGKISCTSRPKEPAVTDISIDGIHVDPATFPTKTSNGLDVTPGDRWIASDYMAVWVPVSDFNSGNHFQIDALNKLNDFEPTGLNGKDANFGATGKEPGRNLTNVDTTGKAELTGTENWHVSTIARPNIGFVESYDLKFHDYFTGSKIIGAMSDGVTFAEPVGSDYRSGDGVVAAGVPYTALNDVFLKGVIDLPKGFINCMTLDNRYTTVVSLPGIKNQGAYVWGNQPEVQQKAAQWVVEYGIGGVDGKGNSWASTKDRQLGTCADDQSTNGAWFPSLDTVPGGAAAITKVRARTTDVYSAAEQLAEIEATHAGGVYSRLVVQLAATNITPADEHAANYQKVYDPSSIWLNGWYQPTYDETTATGAMGDRVVAVGTRVRVTSTTSSTVIAPATPLAISLAPTSDALGVTPAGQAQHVTVTESLPKTVKYLTGSTSCGKADSQPRSCEPAVSPDGLMLTWEFGDIVAGSSMSTITFNVTTPSNAVDGSAITLAAVISATNDNSPADLRTSVNTMTISNPGALVISTTAIVPTVDVGSPVAFNLKIYNVASAPVGQTDFIDWLPYNGDARLPSTTNNGATSLQSITQTAGKTYTVLYSSVDPTTLKFPADLDPSTIDSKIKWCTKAQFGAASCPSGINKVTGLRLQSTGVVGSQELDSFDVTLAHQAGAVDVNNDHLTNRFRGRAKGLSAVVESNNATVAITASQLGSVVWADANANGIRENNETGVQSANVQLINTANVVVATTTTDSTGKYAFKNLKKGVYKVKVNGPSGRTWGYSPDHRGSDLTDSDVAQLTGVTPDLIVNSGTKQPAVDAGLTTYTPSVKLVYSVNGDDANTSPGAAGKPGKGLALTFDVTNTGNVSLGKLRLTSLKVPAKRISCPKATLNAGETMQCTAVRSTPAKGTVFNDIAAVVMSPIGGSSGLALNDVRASDGVYAHRQGDVKGEVKEKGDNGERTDKEIEADKRDAEDKRDEDAKQHAQDVKDAADHDKQSENDAKTKEVADEAEKAKAADVKAAEVTAEKEKGDSKKSDNETSSTFHDRD